MTPQALSEEEKSQHCRLDISQTEKIFSICEKEGHVKHGDHAYYTKVSISPTISDPKRRIYPLNHGLFEESGRYHPLTSSEAIRIYQSTSHDTREDDAEAPSKRLA